MTSLLLTDKLKDAAISNQAHDSAIPDIIGRAKQTWTILDGETVATGADGVPILKGGVRITMDQWLEDLAATAPHLFKPSNGAGTPPGGGDKPGPGGSPTKRSAMSDPEKVAYIEEFGREAYQKIPL